MRQRNGFTLIELVVVVLILGILAAVAAPRMFNIADDAKESSLRHDLAIVRDAIDLYAARNGGELPGNGGTEADLKADLAELLRRFPSNPVKGSAEVAVQTTGGALTGTVIGGAGWRYDNQTGQFIANSNGISSDGVRRYYEL